MISKNNHLNKKFVVYQSMKKYIVFLFITFCSNYHGSCLAISSTDSLGMTTQKGKSFILHEVEAGETLYALSRMYAIDVQSIINANDESVTSLNVGQKILIPFYKKTIIEEGKLHTVKSSETLFSISRQYNVKVDELIKWNNLADNSISVGQKLIIKIAGTDTTQKDQHMQGPVDGQKMHTVEQSQTLYSISRTYEVSTDQLKEWNSLESNVLDIGQVLIVSSSSTQLNAENTSSSSLLPSTHNNDKHEVNIETSKATESNEVVAVGIIASEKDNPSDPEIEIIEKPLEKIVQKGFAEVIENTTETKKYLALHREAPIGTIMQVRNEMNSQSVFVRIVGLIPETGDNSKVILKISKKAYDRLGAVDSRFPVEISYIP